MIKKEQRPILFIFIAGFIIFSIILFIQGNKEFYIYLGVMIAAALLVYFSNLKVNYPNYVLWGLVIWAFLHMGGGSIYVNGAKLYGLILVPISQTYNVFRYDQFAHIFGFGVATLVSYYVLKPLLQKKHPWTGVSIIVVMAGLGFGAVNEIIEFFATVFIPNTGVGGYINNAVDLVSNFIGALIALVIIRKKEK